MLEDKQRYIQILATFRAKHIEINTTKYEILKKRKLKKKFCLPEEILPQDCYKILQEITGV